MSKPNLENLAFEIISTNSKSQGSPLEPILLLAILSVLIQIAQWIYEDCWRKQSNMEIMSYAIKPSFLHKRLVKRMIRKRLSPDLRGQEDEISANFWLVAAKLDETKLSDIMLEVKEYGKSS